MTDEFRHTAWTAEAAERAEAERREIENREAADREAANRQAEAEQAEAQAAEQGEPTRHEHCAGYGVTAKFPADEAPSADVDEEQLDDATGEK